MTKLARSAGVLLPIPSLPSRFGIGDLGPAAYRFAAQLAAAGLRYWQLLPWGPTTPALDNSPYNALSAFAGNPLWISPELLYEEGFCLRGELSRLRSYTPRVDYTALEDERMGLLQRCFEQKPRWRRMEADFEAFCFQERHWLEEWSLFALLREQHAGAPWYRWSPEARERQAEAIATLRRRFSQRLRFHAWVQWLFFRQLQRLQRWCAEHAVELIGDMPLFVAYDSADVWAHPERFLLSAEGHPEVVSGAPPDAFNPQGQRWGQPLYRWEVHQAEGFRWWRHRVSHALRFVRWLRLDHFRGYAACWAIPASAETAAQGYWMPSPGSELLRALQRFWMPLPLLPEDLGIITPDVDQLRRAFGLSSMRVLLFAFPNPASNPHAPHTYDENCVVYTSVHDTPPIRGWFRTLPESLRRSVAQYCGKSLSERTVSREFVRMALQSPAWLVIVPVQDLCALGSDAQLNQPGTATGNWRWRLPPTLPRAIHWESIAEMCSLYQRSVR